MRRSLAFACLILLGALTGGIPLRAQAQLSDYSTEPFVIESRSIKATFENDGTSTMIVYARIRIQSQAGVQGFGVLTFPYASATSTMQVAYVRVIKPDKGIVETPSENVLDMPSDVMRQAPFYSDIKDLQVAVKGLESGDALEFETHEQTSKPLLPGQFWGQFEFFREGIVLQETLELRVPAGRAVKVKSAKIQPLIKDSGAYKTYLWTTQNLTHPSTNDESSGDPEPSDVQMTSFQSWDELGQWFHTLFAPRAAPSKEIQTKAEELTGGAATDTAKIQAVYSFVSTKFRYIGIALGIGRYQPHAAEDILSNDYGDCKDKHTLLVSLLAAVGIKAYPALVNSRAKIDPDVPSPAQFDHVITAIPQGKGFMFLDSTPEVAPFGYLWPQIRDEKSFVIPDAGSALFVQTPAEPPFPTYFDFQADGAIDSSGTLNSKMQMTFRGDPELGYRVAFRQAGESQWKDVMQQISKNLGFGGTVADVNATPPDTTDVPFHLGYSYTREKYSDWGNQRISPPFPPVFIPDAPDETEKNPKPVKLGSPAVSDYKASIQLPANVTPQLPPPVHLSEDFAEYSATYSLSGGVLHAERRLETKTREVPSGKLEAYRSFVKAILDDENTMVSLSGEPVLSSDISGSADARELYQQGVQAWQVRNLPGAIDALQRAVDKDPRFAQAWIALGSAHAQTGLNDKAIEEFRKAIALEPGQTIPYQALSFLLISQHRQEEALAAWRDLEKAAPQNPEAPRNIAKILMSMKRYSEAVPELESAVKAEPSNPAFLNPLGTAYARLGDKDKAIATLEKSAQVNSSDNNLNDVAYALADANLQLDEALKFAQQAAKDKETETAGIDLNHLTESNLRTPATLASYWDTLGWVYFRMERLDEAEKYLDAGWHVGQDPTIGDHLGQLYEKEGKSQQAIRSYSDVLATRHAPEDTAARLEALRPRTSPDWGKGIDPLQLQSMRMFTVKVSPKPRNHATVEFFVLLAPGPKVASLKFLREQDEFPGAIEAIESAKFEAPFPSDAPAQLLRRGFLDCEPELPDCTIALIPPGDVRSVN